MQKRLVVSGFGCPKAPWEKFFAGAGETEVLPFAEVLAATGSSDFKRWGKYVADRILESRPTSLVCHDYGGVETFLALLRLHRRGTVPKIPITILSTAFRGFNLRKNPHPLKIQLAGWEVLQKKFSAAGAELDEQLRPFLPLIKSAYRKLALGCLARDAMKLVGAWHPKRVDLGAPLQILASPDDKFIDLAAVRDLENDFVVGSFREIPYGHFPYSAPGAPKVRELILSFEYQNQL
jgi:hypothetical protein